MLRCWCSDGDEMKHLLRCRPPGHRDRSSYDHTDRLLEARSKSKEDTSCFSPTNRKGHRLGMRASRMPRADVPVSAGGVLGRERVRHPGAPLHRVPRSPLHRVGAPPRRHSDSRHVRTPVPAARPFPRRYLSNHGLLRRCRREACEEEGAARHIEPAARVTLFHHLSGFTFHEHFLVSQS